MNSIATLASARHRAARRAKVPHARYSLAVLRKIIATYRARRRFRWDLEQIARDNPHLIDDMGLARWQVEAEIAKRFWEV